MSLRNELKIFLGALGFFTRLPVPRRIGSDASTLACAIRYFPAAGLVVGTGAALVFSLAALFWPKTLAILAALSTAIMLTGALHEDGWSDSIDGLAASEERSEALAQMRDSRQSGHGATGLVALLLVRFFALLELDTPQIPLALIAAHALSRLCATGVLARLDYVRREGKAKPFANRLCRSESLLATGCGLAPLLFLPPAQTLAALLPALAATLWLARLFQRRLGGYTGDSLGATQQLAEVVIYAGLLCAAQ